MKKIMKISLVTFCLFNLIYSFPLNNNILVAEEEFPDLVKNNILVAEEEFPDLVKNKQILI